MNIKNRLLSFGCEFLAAFGGWSLVWHYSHGLAFGLGTVVGLCLVAYWRENPMGQAANQDFTADFNRRLALVKVDSAQRYATESRRTKTVPCYEEDRYVQVGFKVCLDSKPTELSPVSGDYSI